MRVARRRELFDGKSSPVDPGLSCCSRRILGSFFLANFGLEILTGIYLDHLEQDKECFVDQILCFAEWCSDGDWY